MKSGIFLNAWDRRGEFLAEPIPHLKTCIEGPETIRHYCEQTSAGYSIDGVTMKLPHCRSVVAGTIHEALENHLESEFGPIANAKENDPDAVHIRYGIQRTLHLFPCGYLVTEAKQEMDQERKSQARIAEWDTRRKLKQRKRTQGYIYFYGSEDGKLGYVGQTIYPSKRRRDHMHGRHPATLKLNATLAERGETGHFMFWKVGSERSLDEWEKYYAEKYREQGTTLVNVAPLFLSAATRYGVHSGDNPSFLTVNLLIMHEQLD